MAGEAPVEPPKTNSALPVAEADLSLEPFIFNGRVFNDFDPEDEEPMPWLEDEDFEQGSGVIAGNSKVFFTSAHVLYDRQDEWNSPPRWQGVNDVNPQGSRGYFRWSTYAGNTLKDINLGQNSADAFSKDVALVWSFVPFIEGAPATLDYNGYKRLKTKKQNTMLTGFPQMLDYTGEDSFGLHATEPGVNLFAEDAAKFLHATHISTGPSSLGGPMWVQNPGGDWNVAGIQVYSRPSEAGIYAFNPASKGLMKAAAPMLGDVRKSVNNVTKGFSTSVGHYVMSKPKKVPDGLHQWTMIPFKIQRFEPGTEVCTLLVDINITTNHRGDLMVGVMAPTGDISLIHDGGGGGEDDLTLQMDALFFFQSKDAMEKARDVPNGNWAIVVQDRLKGDPAVVTRAELEIGVMKEGVITFE